MNDFSGCTGTVTVTVGTGNPVWVIYLYMDMSIARANVIKFRNRANKSNRQTIKKTEEKEREFNNDYIRPLFWFIHLQQYYQKCVKSPWFPSLFGRISFVYLFIFNCAVPESWIIFILVLPSVQSVLFDHESLLMMTMMVYMQLLLLMNRKFDWGLVTMNCIYIFGCSSFVVVVYGDWLSNVECRIILWSENWF